MNAFFVIILAALLGEYALGMVANLLNLRALRPEPPPYFEEVYKPDDYRRSQEYTRTTTRFELVTNSFKLLLLLAFWLVGGFNYLDELVRGWDFPSIVTGLLYFALLLLAYMLLTLPFSIYATFVIEERFGF